MPEFKGGFQKWADGFRDLRRAHRTGMRDAAEVADGQIRQGFDEMRDSILGGQMTLADEAFLITIDRLAKAYAESDDDSLAGLIRRLNEIMQTDLRKA